MATFVLVHGATAGGWYWRPVAALLRRAGHEAFTPTLTGLGEREHLATPDVGLATHVLDVEGVLRYEDLRDVVLVGKSYAGMVITGVAHRVPERLAHLVYLDAVVPQDGQSVADVLRAALGEQAVTDLFAKARAEGDGWRMPLRRTDEPRFAAQPMKTFLDPVTAAHPGAAGIPRTYIYCTETSGSAAAFTRQGAAIARARGWGYHELPSGHEPEKVMPEAVAALLLQLA